jgi:microcystin-dependent protein
MSDATTAYAGLTKPTVGADSNAWGGLLNADLDIIDSFLRTIVPSGTVFSFAGSVGSGVPAGFLLCDGSEVSRTTYAALFAAIGATWGAGNESTTFNLPNLANRFLAGVGTDSLGAAGGAASVTPALSISVGGTALTTDQLPAHSHSATDSGHNHGLSSNTTGASLTDGGHEHSSIDGQNAVGASFPAGSSLYPVAGTVGVVIGAVTSNNGANLTFNDPSHSHTVASGAASVSIGNTGSGDTHTHLATASGTVATLPPYRAVNFIIKT